jgi:peptide/nickel transport system permease protein
VTTVCGVTVATLIAGSVVIENAFALGGLGSLLVQAVTAKDFAVVQAVSVIFVLMFIVINTAVDLLYAVIDPRLRRPRA